MARAQAVDPRKLVEAVGANGELWANDRYVCAVQLLGDDRAGPLCLTIRRKDWSPIRDWGHLQRIKTEVAGADREAFEVYPAEARVMDSSNASYLWVTPAGSSIDVGWNEGVISTGPDGEVTRDGEPLDGTEPASKHRRYHDLEVSDER